MKINISDKMWMYIAQAFDEQFDKEYPGTPPGGIFKDEKRLKAVRGIKKSGGLLLRALELACEGVVP